MTPETRAQLIAANEDVLETHMLGFRGFRRWVCTGCEWTCGTGYDPQAYAEHRHHLADLLTDAVLAHRESIVCPTCEGTGKGQSRYGSRWIIGGDPCHCTDGSILGPTVLVERAEYEQVGWYLERGNFSYGPGDPMSAPDEARAELVEALARADYIHRGESPPSFWEDLPEWQRAKHRDYADQQVDDALAHPATLIAALGGEPIDGHNYTDSLGFLCLSGVTTRLTPMANGISVVVFPALEDK